jgi:hypothetical protein
LDDVIGRLSSQIMNSQQQQIRNLQISVFSLIMSLKGMQGSGQRGRWLRLAIFWFLWIINFPLSGFPFRQLVFLPRSIQERKMKKALAILIASVFVGGSALAQAPAGGAAGATGAAAGGITAGMVAAAVAVVAVAVAVASTNDDNKSSTPATGTAGGT